MSFMYGNYDGKGKTPTFDLYLGVNKWDTGSDRCIKYINKGNYASILIRRHLCLSCEHGQRDTFRISARGKTFEQQYLHT